MPNLKRILLLLMLPVIGTGLYLEGQSYDPSRVVYSPRGSSGVSQTIRIKGFTQSGHVKKYTKEDLYEYIDGHAEYFISAGFRELRVSEYKASPAEDTPGLKVELYDMGTPLQALGVLEDERTDGMSPIDVGQQGYITEGLVTFIKGPFYVRVLGYRPDIPLTEVAREVSKTLPRQTEDLQMLNRLPRMGTPLRTRYYREAYRGLSLLNNVLAREYDVGGRTVEVSLVEDRGGEILNSLLGFLKESGIKYNSLTSEGLSLFRIEDPYEGNWYIIPSGGYTYMVFGEVGPAQLTQVLREVKRVAFKTLP